MFNKPLLFLLLLFFSTATAGAAERTLTLAYVSTSNPPLAYSDNEDNKGILIDLAMVIGKRSGIVFQPRTREQDLIPKDMENKVVDAAIAGIYKSEKKDGNFLYSNSFLDDKAINAYRAKGLKRNNVNGLGDPITGILAGAYNLAERTFNDDYNSECENVESGKTTLKDMRGNPPTDPCDRKKSYIGLKIIRSGYFDHIFHKGIQDIDFSLVLQKDYESLLPAINSAIAEMKQDGTIDHLFEAYVEKKKVRKMNDGE